MKAINIDVENIDFTKTVSHYGSIYGLSDNAMRNRFKQLGIYEKFAFVGKNKHVSVVKREIARGEYAKSPKMCPVCQATLPYESRTYRFCSLKCSAIWSNSHRSWVPTEEFRQQARVRTVKLQSVGKCLTPTKPRVECTCPVCEKNFQRLESSTKQFCSRKCADIGKDKSKMGGIRQKSGRGKSGWYKGVFCNSSWELAWVIYTLDHGETFTRNTIGFEYVFGGKTHRYYPDFLLNDGATYVEVKGYNTEQWKAKKEQFPYTLHIIGKEEIKSYIKYVVDKYGSDFIRLYEGNPHNEKKNVCLICGKPCKNKYCSRSCGGKAVGRNDFSTV